MIGTDVASGRMPVWPPDTTYKRFLYERILTTTQRNDIISWVNSGCLKGDTTLAPPQPTYPRYKLCGIPSMVLQIPTYTVTSNGDMYNCFAISTGLTQDRWLRAYEIVPGNGNIVHHLVIFLDTTGTATSDTGGNCFPFGYVQLGAWAPGSEPTVFPGQVPLKAGTRIKAGSKIILQIHYAPGSLGQVDSTKMRMYFYPTTATGIRPVYCTDDLKKPVFSVAAFSTQSYLANPVTLTSDRTIFAVFPHSHTYCDSIRVWADLGANNIKLIRIKEWNFDFQGYYTFKSPVKVPSGYTLRAKHTFTNPNATPVNSCPTTSCEMILDFFQWLNYQAGDENIDVASLLAGDSLLSCPPPPYSQFSASTSTICQGGCINFTDLSTNAPTSWAWNFPGGNPSTSTQKNPQNICYNTPGTYTVTLTASNASGSNYGCGVVSATRAIIVQVCTGTGQNPSGLMVSSIHPNPFNETVTINYELQSSAFVQGEIFSMYGSRIKTLSSSYETAGSKRLEWDGRNETGEKAPAGIYFFVVKAGNNFAEGKMLLLPR